MENFKLVATKNTPEVFLNVENQHFEISGMSIPSNAEMVYGKITDWVEKYIENKYNAPKIHINLEFMNTSSSKWITSILGKLQTAYRTDNNFEVFWHFTEEDQKELGIYLEDLLNIKITLVEESE